MDWRQCPWRRGAQTFFHMHSQETAAFWCYQGIEKVGKEWASPTWYNESAHELANHVTGERKEMKSFLLKISECHLLTNLGRLAQLPLWQPSQVYVENSLEVIVKVSKSGFARCRLNSFNLTYPCLSLLSDWGKRQENLLGEVGERVWSLLNRYAQTQCRHGEIC